MITCKECGSAMERGEQSGTSLPLCPPCNESFQRSDRQLGQVVTFSLEEGWCPGEIVEVIELGDGNRYLAERRKSIDQLRWEQMQNGVNADKG